MNFVLRKITTYFIMSFVIFSYPVYAFTSLQQVKEYANSLEEYPNIDNKNWLNPKFASYHTSLVPNFFSRFLADLGIFRPAWSPYDLQTLLQDVTKYRELRGNEGRFVQILEPEEGAQFYIWGDLHGAFHSFVRALVFLEKKGIIDTSFKLKNPQDYLVFNGNAIDLSSYSAETLTLILKLMHLNPDRVYYVRGPHEDKQLWHDFGLGLELKARASYMGQERIPLDTEITSFFNTLPLALYLKGQGAAEKINFVRISPTSRDNLEINEKRFSGDLENPPKEKQDVYLGVEGKISKKPVFMHAIIRNEDRTKQFTQTNGLVMHDPEEEAASWSILSAPTGTFRRMFDFFYDAFAVLTVTGPITDWTISLYNQDLREKLGFHLAKTYALTSGAIIKEPQAASIATKTISKGVADIKSDVEKLGSAFEDIKKELKDIKQGVSAQSAVVAAPPAAEPKPAVKAEEPKSSEKAKPVAPKEEEKKIESPQPDVGSEQQKAVEKKTPVTQKTLTFGSTLDLSKGERFAGKQLKNSMTALLNNFEQKGQPIEGFYPKVIFSDDEYNPAKARENVMRFIEQGINKLIICVGSPTLENFLDLIKEKKVAAYFPTSGAPMFRKPDLTNLIHFRKSYFDEGKLTVSYALDRHKAKKIAILYQNDAFGLGALEGAIELAKERGIDYEKEWTLIPYERADLNLTAQVEKIKSVNPDALIFLSVVSVAKEIINRLGVSFLDQRKLISLSNMSEKDFADYAKEKGLQFITMNVLPNPVTSDYEIAKEFRELSQKENIGLDTYAFEGYVAGSLILDALQKVNGNITNESLLKYFEGLKNVNFKGLELDFNPETRELSKYLWINEGDPIWRQYAVQKGKKTEEKEVGAGQSAAVAPPATAESKPAVKAEEPKSSEKAKPVAPKEEEKKIESPKPDVGTEQQKAVEKKTPVTQKTLTFGSTLDLSKGERFAGKQLKNSMTALLNNFEQKGQPIEGFYPKVIFSDDEYNPAKARENVLRFIEQGINKLIICVGSPTLENFLDLIKEKKVAAYFPTSGAPMFRKPDLTNLIHFRKSYFDEGKLTVSYALDRHKAKKIAILYQNDAFGLGALEGAIELAQERGIDYEKEWTLIPYERADLNLTAQVEKIKSVNPDALIFLSVVSVAKEIINRLGVSFLDQRKLISLSNMSEKDFADYAKEKGLQFITMNVLPNPVTSDYEIAKEFRELSQKENIGLDTYAFEGYVAGSLILDALQKVNGNITNESLLKYFEGLKNVNFKGLELDFNPETRELSKYLWINEGDPIWRQYAVQKGKKTEEKEVGAGQSAAVAPPPAAESKPAVKAVEPKPMDKVEPEKSNDQKKKAEAPALDARAVAPGAGEKKEEKPKEEVKKEEEPAKVSITEKMLTFGSTLDLSKGERYAGTQLKAGMSLYLKKMRENQESIHGVIPKIIFVDDEYTVAKARENIERFIGDGIDKTICSMGTPTLEGYLDYVIDKKIGVFFPATGALIFRNPDLKYVINLRASYAVETKLLVEHALDVLKANKLAFFVQNDAYGKGAFEGAKQVAKKRNIDFEKQWVTIFYERAEINLNKQAGVIKDTNPDTIIFLSTPTPTKELIQLLTPSYLAEKKLLATSDFGEAVFKKFMQEKGLNMVVTNIVPNPIHSDLPIVKEFREYAQKNNVEIDPNALEGFMGVGILVDVLKKMKGEITTESIIAQMEQIKDYDYKGIQLNFNKETRELSKFLWIDTGTSQWQEVAVT